MSEPSSSLKKMLASLSKIDPVSFYTPSSLDSKSKVPTTSEISPSLDNPQNPFHSIDLNSPSLLLGLGPYLEMLSDTIFEGDLPEIKTFESNILAAREELVIESLTLMREEARLEECEIPP